MKVAVAQVIASDTIVGAAAVMTSDTLVTCAHVIDFALRSRSSDPVVGAEIHGTFPFSKEPERFSAVVVMVLLTPAFVNRT